MATSKSAGPDCGEKTSSGVKLVDEEVEFVVLAGETAVENQEVDKKVSLSIPF